MEIEIWGRTELHEMLVWLDEVTAGEQRVSQWQAVHDIRREMWMRKFDHEQSYWSKLCAIAEKAGLIKAQRFGRDNRRAITPKGSQHVKCWKYIKIQREKSYEGGIQRGGLAADGRGAEARESCAELAFKL